MVDLQRYYLEADAPFVAYSERRWAGSTAYIRRRVDQALKPALARLIPLFRSKGWPIAYLRLCSERPDRSDLHRFFVDFHRKALAAGYPGAYPLASEPLAEPAPWCAPEAGDLVVDKRGYSGFCGADLDGKLKASGVDTLLMAGLATSQCVDTTARDASDRGYKIAFAEDALADYNEDFHRAALYASAGVCGAQIFDSDGIEAEPELLRGLR